MRYLLLFCLLLFFSCEKQREQKVYLKTVIDSTNLKHIGKGFYNEFAFLKFTHKGKKYKKTYKVHSKTRAYNYYYLKGDSVLISFPKSKPKNASIIKKISD